MVDTIRENPIPVALIALGALGAGWMSYNARSGRSHDRAKHLTADAAIKVRDVTRAAGEAAAHLAHDAKEAAADIAHRAGDAASTVAEKAKEGAELVETKAKEGAHFVSHGFETQMRDNPLAIGAVALAIGVAAGMMIPTTRREDKLMGSARDQLLDSAQHVAHDAVTSAQEKLSEALGASHHTNHHA